MSVTIGAIAVDTSIPKPNLSPNISATALRFCLSSSCSTKASIAPWFSNKAGITNARPVNESTIESPIAPKRFLAPL